MKDPHANALFTRIETRAKLPNGKVITSTRSYPTGATKEEYDRIDADLVKAYGNEGSWTKGTFKDESQDGSMFVCGQR